MGQSRQSCAQRGPGAGLRGAEVGHEFRHLGRERHWAAVPRNWEDELGAARVAADDLEPVIVGTFDDVVHAYDQEALTAADYTILVHAVTQALRSTGDRP